TAARAAAAAARPTLSHAAGVTAGLVSVGGGPLARIGAGRIATGTVRRTFMKPPRMTGGQWRRSTHLSMCHPNRRRKSERANNSPPFPSAGIIPGAGGGDVRIDSHGERRPRSDRRAGNGVSSIRTLGYASSTPYGRQPREPKGASGNAERDGIEPLA